jgi:hypothetical protein
LNLHKFNSESGNKVHTTDKSEIKEEEKKQKMQLVPFYHIEQAQGSFQKHRTARCNTILRYKIHQKTPCLTY